MTTPTLSRLACAGLLAASLGGCSNMSGVGGSSEYGCKAPAGVQCDSISGNYANALQHNLPGQRSRLDGAAPPSAPAAAGGASQPSSRKSTLPLLASTGDVSIPSTKAGGTATATAPLRSQPRILRLWVKPWEDSDHDLIEQGYVYVQVDNGQWLVDHAQQAIREAYAPVRAPRAAHAAEPMAQLPGAPNGRVPGDSSAVTPVSQAMQDLRAARRSQAQSPLSDPAQRGNP